MLFMYIVFIFSLKMDYVYIFCIYRKYMVASSSLVIQKISNISFHIVHIENYNLYYIKKIGLLIFLLYGCIIFYGLLSIEVSTFNFIAISIYLWLGFSILNIRLNYYNNNTHCLSGYNLFSYKFLSKNSLRRYLIFDNR
uniref:Uncharacterized protein n=1 Tax=Leiomenia cribrosa TaxID=217483 RepID=A0A4D6WVH7_9FLOR|nr:hypothetical protein [Leiomenia cribrosa]